MKKLFSLLILSLLLTACQQEEAKPEAFRVYFPNASLAADPNSCEEVFPVERLFLAGTESDEAKLEAAITELLKGPTFFEESDQEYSSFFSVETQGYLIDANIEDKIAYINFKDFREIIPNASSSCGSTQLLAALNHTALQFEDVERAIYAFDGSAKDFYEWLQMSAPEESFLN